MRVRFFAYLRNITGCAEADIPFEKTAGALARSICELYGDKMRQKIFSPSCQLNAPESGDGEKFSPDIIILINGRHVSHLGGPGTLLSPDDRVDVFPMVAGG
jgi:molybdopterin synthase sulfur carrier subunit